MDMFHGMTLYIVFKHVYTESDTGDREYEFQNVFTNLEVAKEYCSVNYNSHNYYGGLVIDTLIFDINAKQIGELYWEPKYNKWISRGAFKTVSPKDIIPILTERKFVCIDK